MAQTCHQQQRAVPSNSANDKRGSEKLHIINGKEQDKVEIAVAGSANSGHNPHNAPLNIAIVGAGIGGLTAAIGLRQNGHNVALYEQSRFANEVGAAIHLAPNANGILRRYGVYMERFGAVHLNRVARYNDRGTVTKLLDLTDRSKIWQHPWQLSHRVHLHDALKRAATSEDGIGKPAILYTSSRVTNVDTEKAIVTLKNGELIKADLVIGADGVYSKMRSFVSGRDSEIFGSGKAAFRFLVEREKALKNPETASIVKQNGEMGVWHGSDRRVVMYPCDSNKLLNFACIHPDTESRGDAEEWNKEASLEQLLRVFERFPPGLLEMFKMADPASINVWKLLDMGLLPTWIKGRLALLGESAHPMLPYQGQGGGAAIEDAAALVTVLPFGTKPEEIPELLKLYEKIRYDRAHVIQEYSRQAGQDPTEGKPEIDMISYTRYTFNHDEVDYASQMLKEWRYEKKSHLRWRAPLGFGPALSLRPQLETEQPTFASAAIKFKTSGTFLQNLFPTKSFAFKSPGTVVLASFIVNEYFDVGWVAGTEHKQFGLHLHNVEFTKKDGSSIIGTYIPVLFENSADSIIAGRDGLGLPTVYSDIKIQRRQQKYRMQASWNGAKFLDLELDGLATIDSPTARDIATAELDQGDLVHRYIPAVENSAKEKADCNYSILIPRAAGPTAAQMKEVRVNMADKARVAFNKLKEDCILTMHHIVDVLADIPIYEVVSAKFVEGTGYPEMTGAKRIE